MTLLPETRAALARYDAWAARFIKDPDQVTIQARRLERKTRSVARRMRNMLLGAFGVMLAAFLFGLFVAPLGFAGIVVTVLGAILAMVLLSGWPKELAVKPEAMAQVPLPALPQQVDQWLEGQRRMLPPPAARDVDHIAAQLDRLAPELARLDPQSVMADDARRLLGDHLPRLVETYRQVPATHRATPEATTRLREGLRVVSDELERMSRDIARDGMDRLEVEGRFLESRYKDTGRIKG